MKSGAMDEALELLDKGIAKWPNEPQLYLSAAIMNLMVGDNDSSLRLASRGAELAAGDVELQLRFARVLFEIEQVDAAEEIVRELAGTVAEGSPLLTELTLLRGLILERGGQHDAADQVVYEVLGLEPRDAAKELVDEYLSTNLRADALRVVERALIDAPDDAWLLKKRDELST